MGFQISCRGFRTLLFTFRSSTTKKEPLLYSCLLTVKVSYSPYRSWSLKFDLVKKNNQGMTPIDYALHFKHSEVTLAMAMHPTR